MNLNPNDGVKNKILKILRWVLIAALIIAGLFIFFKYLVLWFLPFLIAWFIALIIQPAVRFLHTKLKLPQKLATIIFLLILFAALVTGIFFAVNRIIDELNFLATNFSITETTNRISDAINNFFAWLENIPFIYDNNIVEQLKEYLRTETGNFLSQLVSADKIQTFIRTIAITIPQLLIFILITIVSTFYIALDFKHINKFISAQIPVKIRAVINDIKSRFLDVIYKYLKAYFTIYVITYSELTVGFLIIGIKYAFLIAFIIALVDILPVLGTGTVLIPWGIISIIQKDYFTGFALLILYAVIMIIRNIIEPKIVGSSIGLYPVVTLMAIFVGYNIFGGVGIFLMPITVLILKNLNDEGKIHIWKTVKKEESEEEKKDNKKNKNKKDKTD